MHCTWQFMNLLSKFVSHRIQNHHTLFIQKFCLNAQWYLYAQKSLLILYANYYQAPYLFCFTAPKPLLPQLFISSLIKSHHHHNHLCSFSSLRCFSTYHPSMHYFVAEIFQQNDSITRPRVSKLGVWSSPKYITILLKRSVHFSLSLCVFVCVDVRVCGFTFAAVVIS